MTKQEYLDQEPTTNEMWATQQMLNSLTKTRLLNLKSAMKQIEDVLYKSWAKDMKFSTVLNCLINAEEMARTGKLEGVTYVDLTKKQPDDKMDNAPDMGRQGNGGDTVGKTGKIALPSSK